MIFVSVLFSTILAATTVISPLSNSPIPLNVFVNIPATSFGSLMTPVPSPTPTPRKVEQPKIFNTAKPQYTIALLGDSMIDTLGSGVPNINRNLIKLFPKTSFILLNYGVGATNIDYGIERLTNSYTYLGVTYPSLVSQNPDVVVVESFGYNPYASSEGAIDKHWLALAKIVDILRKNIPTVKIIIAATIAPNSFVFGNGAPGITLNLIEKFERTLTIKSYLENTVRFAKSEHLPLADAYHPSLDILGNGKLRYINAGDHIHYSEAGREFFAEIVVNAILINHIFRETPLAL